MIVAPREDRLGLAVAILAVTFFLFATMDTIANSQSNPPTVSSTIAA